MTTVDANTFRRLQSGDEAAQRWLYDHFHRRILAFCYSLTTDRDLAADLTQNVFLKVLSKINTLERPEAFGTWIFAIARNEVYQHFRSTQRVQPLDDEDIWETSTPAEAMIAAERTAIVRSLVDRLQPLYREVIILREFEGLSYRDIARVVGCTEAAVKARLFKARKALLDKLTQIFREE